LKRKNLLVYLFVFLFLVPIFSKAYSFYYVYNSLVEDQKYASSKCVITEGYYFLVIDNTGLITENYKRNDTYINYFIYSLTANYTIKEGRTTIIAGDYLVVEFQFEYEDLLVTEIKTEVYSQNPVSIFITNHEGLTEYAEEVESIGMFSSTTVLIIAFSSIGGALILAAAVYLTIKHLHPRIVRYRAKRRKILKPVKCPKCGNLNEPGVTVCSNCGENIKRTGDIIKTIG